MQQIADWLEELGMSEYAQRFADNDIDLTILRDLTDQDLKELGVASLGHRRKLLRAIAELEDAPAATHSEPATSSATSAPAVPLAIAGGRRGDDHAGAARLLAGRHRLAD